MTVEEFSQLCDTTAPGERLEAPGGAEIGKPPSADGLAKTAAPQLLRRTVTVTYRGPSLDDLRTISSLQSKLNTATEIHTKDESKPGGIFSLWFLIGLLPLVAGVLIWRLKPSLFGVAFGAALAALKAVWNVAKSLFGRKAS